MFKVRDETIAWVSRQLQLEMEPKDNEPEPVYIRYSYRGGQFVLLSSLNTTTLSSAQKVAILNFVYEVKAVPVRRHLLYLLGHLLFSAVAATFFALTFVLGIQLLILPAILSSMGLLLFLLRYFYIVRSASIKWHSLVDQLKERLPDYTLTSGRFRGLLCRMYFSNCRGLELRLVPPPTLRIHIQKPPTSASDAFTSPSRRNESLSKHINQSTAASNKRLTVAGTTETMAEQLVEIHLGKRGTVPDLWNEEPPKRPHPVDTSILEEYADLQKDYPPSPPSERLNVSTQNDSKGPVDPMTPAPTRQEHV